MPVSKNLPFEPSTIENVDAGFYEYVDKVFDIHTNTNSGFVKVPLMWISAERAFQAKNDRDIRDSIGKLKLPVITIERSSVEKDPSFKGAYQAHISPAKEGEFAYKSRVFPIARRVNQEKTRDLAVAESNLLKGDKQTPNVGRGGARSDTFGPDGLKIVRIQRVVKETYYSPLPTYIKVVYIINLRTEYQQQMNEMLTPFITKTGQINHFVIEHNKHRYEAFIEQDFGQNNNLANMGEDERAFHSKIQIKVLGYLNGEDVNDPKPKITTRENLVVLKMSRERVMIDDEIPWKAKDKKYRE